MDQINDWKGKIEELQRRTGGHNTNDKLVQCKRESGRKVAKTG